MKKGEKIKLKKERTNNIQSAKWFPQTGKENTRRCTKSDKDKKDTPNQNKGQNVYLVRQSAAKLPISFTVIEEDRPPYLCFCSTPPPPPPALISFGNHTQYFEKIKSKTGSLYGSFCALVMSRSDFLLFLLQEYESQQRYKIVRLYINVHLLSDGALLECSSHQHSVTCTENETCWHALSFLSCAP